MSRLVRMRGTSRHWRTLTGRKYAMSSTVVTRVSQGYMRLVWDVVLHDVSFLTIHSNLIDIIYPGPVLLVMLDFSAARPLSTDDVQAHTYWPNICQFYVRQVCRSRQTRKTSVPFSGRTGKIMLPYCIPEHTSVLIVLASSNLTGAAVATLPPNLASFRWREFYSNSMNAMHSATRNSRTALVILFFSPVTCLLSKYSHEIRCKCKWGQMDVQVARRLWVRIYRVYHSVVHISQKV